MLYRKYACCVKGGSSHACAATPKPPTDEANYHDRRPIEQRSQQPPDEVDLIRVIEPRSATVVDQVDTECIEQLHNQRGRLVARIDAVVQPPRCTTSRRQRDRAVGKRLCPAVHIRRRTVSVKPIE